MSGRRTRRNSQYRLTVADGPCLLAFDQPVSDGEYYVLLLPRGKTIFRGALFYDYTLAAERAISYWDEDADESGTYAQMERDDAYGCGGFTFEGREAFMSFLRNLEEVARGDDSVAAAAADLYGQLVGR